MKTFIITILMVNLMGGIYSQDTLKYSLEALFELAEEQDKQVAVKRLEVAIQQFEVQSSKYNRLPEINGRGSADYATNMPIYDNGIFHTPSQHDVIHWLFNTGVDFSLDIYKGGLNELKIQEQELHHSLATIAHEEISARIKLIVANTSLELYRCYQFQEILKEDIHDQEQQLKEITDRYNSGIVLHSDVLRSELELSKRAYLLVEITNDIKRLSQQIQLIIGSQEGTLIYPIIPSILTSSPQEAGFETNFSFAHHHAFSLKTSSVMQELASLNLRRQKANYLPQLQFAGTFTFANPQIFLYPYNPSWYSLGIVGIKLKVPISQWYRNKPNVEKLKVEQLKEEQQHHHEADVIKNQLLQATLNFEQTVIKHGICEQNIQLTKENLRIIRDNYFQSTALITDLLDANINFLKSYFELETAKIDQLKYYYQIEYIKGSL